jgi:hypothetical protein
MELTNNQLLDLYDSTRYEWIKFDNYGIGNYSNSKNIKLEILKILGNELQKRGFRLRKETGGTITWH